MSLFKPTPEEIRSAYMEDNADFLQVDEKSDTSYRHGSYMKTVFNRVSDKTFWEVNWTVSGDGEQNSIRDRELSGHDIKQVVPYEVTVTKYRPVGG